MQAKMEPGNINELQISPTLQATKSNFTREHKGNPPQYLDYFIYKDKYKVLVDQLQTEQSGRFFKKRNRNIIIEVQENIDLKDGFIWLSLGQIHTLMKIDNLINMDSRSVLSTLNYSTDIDLLSFTSTFPNDSIGFYLLKSLKSETSDLHNNDKILSWINDQKNSLNLYSKTSDLINLKDWKLKDGKITNIETEYFEILGVKVNATNREVSTWCQPMIGDINKGLVGFIIKIINNKLYFLVQARVEPGSFDIVDLAPTVMGSYFNYNKQKFADNLLNINNQIIFDTNLSEEGGRFFKFQNRYMIVIDNSIDHENIPSNYIFLTYNQILYFSKYSFFNIESRTLMSCIDFKSDIIL
jgi:oxidase EvaA